MRLSLYRLLSVCLVAGLVFASGCQSRRAKNYSPQLTRIYLEDSSQMPMNRTLDMTLPLSQTHIAVNAKPQFAEWDILHAEHFETDLGPAVLFLLTPSATRDLYRLSLANRGRRLVITINGIPVGARYIDRPVEDGRLAFYIEVDDEEIPELVRNIQLTSQDYQENRQRKDPW